VARIHIVDIVARDDTSPDDLRDAAFSEDDVTWLHLIRELPQGKTIIRLLALLRGDLDHPLPEFLSAGVRPQVTDLSPREPHDAALVKVLPLTRFLARRIQPVAHGAHAVIPEGNTLH
jgi:hypothetical protein